MKAKIKKTTKGGFFMKKFLSVLITVAMMMSMVAVVGQGNVAKAVMNPLEVNIIYPGSSLTVDPYKTFYVNAVIANPASSSVTDTATLTIDDPTKAEILDSASKTISLGDHGVTDVWWKVECLGAGAVKLTVTAGAGSDAVTVTQTGEVPQQPELHITWIETPCMEPNVFPVDPVSYLPQVPVGTYFTVKANIHSDFDYAENVSVKIGYTGGLQLLSAETVPVGDVYTSRDEEVAWNFKCVEEGDASVYIADVTVGNLSPDEIDLPETCEFYQGPYTPPEEPGYFTVTAEGPEKVCTDCTTNTFDITAYGYNYTGDVVSDVYAEISISPLLSATLTTTGENTPRKFVVASVDDSANTPDVSWNITCLLRGLTTFTVKFYAGGGLTLGAGEYLGEDTWTVSQQDYIAVVDDVYADPADPGDFIYNVGDDVYATEVCDTFHVKTTFKNCTCYPLNNVYVQILRDELPAGDLGSVTLDPDSVVTVEEWEIVYDVNSVPQHVSHMKGSYTVPAQAVIDNDYKLPLQTTCACCYFVVYWKFECIGTDSYPIPLIFQFVDGDTGQVLDSDYFDLIQLGAPKLSAGINIFPGWWNDDTLGTSEITGVASSCQGGSLGASSEFSVVIPVANTGGTTATNVYATVNMTGSFGTVIWKDATNKEHLNENVTFPYTFRIDSIPAHSAYKIILETTCIGDEDVEVSVTDLGGFDWLKDGPIPAEDDCGDPNTFLPIDKTLMQIPMGLLIIEPISDTGYEVSSNYAVKIRINNCTNDDTNIVHGLHATLTWSGPAEFNPETNETHTHDLEDLAMGGIAETGWNMHCSGVGDVTFTVTLTADNPALTMTQTVTVHQTPETTLEVTIISPLEGCLVYANDEEFAITAIVENTGTIKDAENVVVTLDFDDDYFGVVEAPPVLTFPVLGPGAETPLLTWTLKVLKGDVPPASQTITVNATADNALLVPDSITVWPYPAAYLKVEITPLADNKVDVGSDFDFNVTVTNIGWADAYDVWTYIYLPDNVALQTGFNNTELYIGTLQGHGGALDSKEVTFKLQCEGAGKAWIQAYAYGKDEYGYSWSCPDVGDTIGGEPIFSYHSGSNIYLVDDASYVFEQVSVSPIGPMLEITSPPDGFETNSSDVMVTFSATGGTAPYTYLAKLDMGTWSDFADNTNDTTGSWLFTGLSLGTHILSIKVIDSNNLSYIDFVNVTIDKTPPPAPSANPGSGNNYPSGQTVTLSDTESGVSIYYTVDGTIPTTESTLYSAPIVLPDGETTLKAIAVDAAGNVSEVMTETYTVSSHILGDLDNDGDVDLTDLSMLMSNWGTSGPTGDINNDGIVDLIDLSILMSHWTG